MSTVRYAALTSETSDFKYRFIVCKFAVGVVTALGYSIMSPPTVRRTWFFSFLCGFNLVKILQYVAFRSKGLAYGWITCTVLEPVNISRRKSWARGPTLLKNPWIHCFASGPNFSCWYSNTVPVVESTTVFTIHNAWAAKFNLTCFSIILLLLLIVFDNIKAYCRWFLSLCDIVWAKV